MTSTGKTPYGYRYKNLKCSLTILSQRIVYKLTQTTNNNRQ